MFWFVILLLIVGGCFFLYQKMMEIEREIRAEQEAQQPDSEKSAPPPVVKKDEPEEKEAPKEAVVDDGINPPLVTPEVESMVAKTETVADESLSLEDEILNAIKNMPGVKQTDLYTSFADVSKKRLQQLLKEMDDNGQLKREKKGSSYLLYPV